MRKLLLSAAWATFGASIAWPALSAPQIQGPDVGVSVQISQPGVYGRIDIGRFPQPQVVVAQPVIIQRPVVVVQQAQQPQVYRAPEPIYMWVPPGHRKNWRKHCREYDACGVPVYFVRDDWYDREVQRRGRERDDDDDDRRGRGRGHDKRD